MHDGGVGLTRCSAALPVCAAMPNQVTCELCNEQFQFSEEEVMQYV